ncbi:RagB/SusD family nutrient uptake outer membrane protein [Arcticibacter tournemirensis]
MKVRSIIFIAITSVMLSACDDFLSPEQVDLVYNEVFWASEKDAEQALLGGYSLYRGLMVGGQMYERGDVTTGYFNRGWNGGSSEAFYHFPNFSNVNGTQKSWGALQSYADWGGYYKVIAQLNMVIRHVSEMRDDLFSGDKKNQILGEAYFLRALIYYHLATIWGAVPVTLDAIENSDQVIDGESVPVYKGRSTETEVMDQVLADIGEAVGRLPFGTPGSAGWGIRANRGSALALSGYANLWMAFIKKRDGQDPSQFTQAAVKALEEVVQKGRYSLVSYSSAENVKNMFRGKSAEAVFEISISYAQGESYRADAGGIQALTCKLVPLDGDVTKDRASNINWIPYLKKSFVYPEYPQDRRSALFFSAWDSEYNEPFSDVSQVSTDRNKVTWMTKFATFMVDPAREWNEYVAYFADCNIPVFRFTDVKLLLAEAYVKSGQDNLARPIVDEIRQRAGLQTYTGSNLLQEILQQRTSDLIGEGKLFFDYVRNDYFPDPASAMTADRYAQKGYYWPVSGNTLINNKLVKQTPYWNGKTTW